MSNKLKILVALALLQIAGVIYAQKPAALRDNYTLKQVVVLSRHNIRSPFSGAGSALTKITPHTWFAWTSQKGELSLRGGELETMMGQYFRKWLVRENLIAENEIPAPKEVRFYANSVQRTIATAQYFSSGMLPVANVKIEHHYPLGTMDPVFTPKLTFINEPFRQKALSQMEAIGGKNGLNGLGEKLAGSYALLVGVLDAQDSEMAKTDGEQIFKTDDMQITLAADKEPSLDGSFRLGTQVVDALTLQYYESPETTVFGHAVTKDDWDKLAFIKDMYGDVLFTAPAVAVNVANPLLKLIKKELSLKKRKFTFLCGHDSNLSSVLAALEVKDYVLPQSIEKTPIGAKVVFGKWVSKDGEAFISLDLVYQTTAQLRGREMLSLDNPPAVFPLQLEGLTPNADGLYPLKDINARLDSAIRAYKNLRKEKK